MKNVSKTGRFCCDAFCYDGLGCPEDESIKPVGTVKTSVKMAKKIKKPKKIKY
ncbi:MAG TPA: hypothetical protein VGD26_12300 [Chitinophagaceae bacterium]